MSENRGMDLKIMLLHGSAVDGAEAVGEHDVRIGLFPVEGSSDALHDQFAGVVIDGWQQKRKLGGAELGDGVALAQVVAQYVQQAFHDVVQHQRFEGGTVDGVDLHQHDEH